MFKGSKNDTIVVDIFKEELNEVENKIKTEIQRELQQIIAKVHTLSLNLGDLKKEIELIKNNYKEQQKIAISSTVEGLARVNLSEAINLMKSEIINFLKQNRLEIDFSELEKRIEEIIHSKYIDLNDKLINIEKSISSISFNKLENEIKELDNKLEEVKNKEISIDFSEIQNKINELENKLNELENKIDYIYKFNKLLEQQLEQKQKETIESEEE